MPTSLKNKETSFTPLNIYQSLLATDFAQKYPKQVTGGCQGIGIAIPMYALDRYLATIKTSETKVPFLNFCKNLLTKKPIGLTTNIIKSSLQLSLIYTLKDPTFDLINLINPSSYNDKISSGLAASFAKLLIYPLSVAEYLSYNHYSYKQMSKLPLNRFYKGYPATALRDFTCFPLLLYVRDFFPRNTRLDANKDAMIIGFLAGLATWPIAAPLSAIGEWQRVHHQNAVSTFKKLYNTGGPQRFFRGSVVTSIQAGAFGLFYNEGLKFTRQAEQENAKSLKI